MVKLSTTVSLQCLSSGEKLFPSLSRTSSSMQILPLPLYLSDEKIEPDSGLPQTRLLLTCSDSMTVTTLCRSMPRCCPQITVSWK